MPTSPTIRYHQVVSPGNGSIAATNMGALGGYAGPVTNILDSSHPFNFESVEAGMWSTPQILLIEFQGNTAYNLSLKVYDTGDSRLTPVTSNLNEDFFANYSNVNTSGASWLFRASLKSTYSDPLGYSTDPGNSPINSWNELAWNNSPLVLDSSRQNTGNDGTTSLLVKHANNTSYFTNFFIYIAAKPRTVATAGEHIGWGFRLSYIYPNV